MNKPIAFAATIGAVALAGGLAIGTYRLGWWLEKDGQERRSEIREELPGTQAARRDEALRAIDDFNVVTDGQAQSTLRAKACRVIATIDSDFQTPAIITFSEGNC